MATLGTFDGFHLGHAAIFKGLARQAAALDLPAVAVTFHPHPRVVVTPEDPPLLLTTPEEKIEILNERFEGSLVFLRFDDQLRQMTAERFAKEILVDRIGIKALVVGYDHGFGHQRSGNIDKLKEIGAREGFDVTVIQPVTHNNMPISSSRIRRAVLAGNWNDAVAMLGHPYAIHGSVIKGLGHGRKMGWPTVNLTWPARKLLPPDGVYSCAASVNGELYKGMMFIGVSMLDPEARMSVEANLFEFDREVYNREVTLYAKHFLRSNARFASAEELSHQIARDKEKALKLLE